MDKRERRAAEIQAAIHDVLLHDWDPIGVADEEQAQDEYDSFIGGVYRLLASGASPEQVAEHLSTVEREDMGWEVPASALLPVARKLCEIDVSLESADGGN